MHKSLKRLGRKIDYCKLRRFLAEKYKVSKAYIFSGYLPEHKELYNSFEKSGFINVFKPVVRSGNVIKGNCDAELVLEVMKKYNEYNKAVIVTGDGDFYCIADYLRDENKLEALLIPDHRSYSSLLREFGNYRNYVSKARHLLEQEKRA